MQRFPTFIRTKYPCQYQIRCTRLLRSSCAQKTVSSVNKAPGISAFVSNSIMQSSTATTDNAPTKSKFELAREERKWNNLSERMSSFHEWFKEEFNTLYQLADGSFTSRGLSLSRYLDMAKSLNSHLTMHHTIEERHVFPVLAKYMPRFGKGEDEVHIKSHRDIHDGLEELQKLVTKWKAEPSTYSPTEMRACLDGFRDVLFRHLDEEVEDLRGENLKKYMTLEQLEMVPI